MIALDQWQRVRGRSFRFPVLAVAVGIYLPLNLSVPIFIGGWLMHAGKSRIHYSAAGEAQRVENRGLLLASGIITGEALTGVLIAIVAVALPTVFPETASYASALAFAAMAAVMVYLVRMTLKARG